MIRARAAFAISILTMALGLAAWIAPARADVDDGEVIFIDSCAPGKVELAGECVLIEDALRFRGAPGSEPTLDWGIVIHVPGGGGGSGTGGSEPTEESCSEEYTDCVNSCWTAFDGCEEVAGLTTDHFMASLDWLPPDEYQSVRETYFEVHMDRCDRNMEWDRKQCKQWEAACLKQARRR
jgi:hypothetical protein